MRDRRNRKIRRMLKECDELKAPKNLNPEELLRRENIIDMLWGGANYERKIKNKFLRRWRTI